MNGWISRTKVFSNFLATCMSKVSLSSSATTLLHSTLMPLTLWLDGPCYLRNNSTLWYTTFHVRVFSALWQHSSASLWKFHPLWPWKSYGAIQNGVDTFTLWLHKHHWMEHFSNNITRLGSVYSIHSIWKGRVYKKLPQLYMNTALTFLNTLYTCLYVKQVGKCHENATLLACLLCCCSWVFVNFKNENENERILG